MPGGYSWDHVDTLKRIDLYYNSRFESGQYDSHGFRKYFYNITKPAIDIASKFVDLDTKDFILTHEFPDQEWIVWVMMHDLKQWMKEQKFGTLLNQIAFNYSKYGHVVMKKVKKGKWKVVPLTNFRTDNTTEYLVNMEFVYELVRMTAAEIRGMNWSEKAEIDTLLATDRPFYDIYECYDYNSKTGGWDRTFKADLFTDNNKNISTEAMLTKEEQYAACLILHKDEIDELPYRELKWESVPGRWLGFGFGEYLFDNQIRENETTNLRARAMYITSLILLQTRDETVGKNILNDLEMGDIIKTRDELRPVRNEERNLPAYNVDDERWDKNSERKTFSFDIARGENLPSATPLGVANLQAGMVTSYFELKRENLALFIKDLILNDIIPSFKAEKAKRHQLTLLSNAEGVEKFTKAYLKTQIDKGALDYAMNGNGFFPTPEQKLMEMDRLMSEMRGKRSVSIEIPDRIYTDAKYTFDIMVGEQTNPGALTQTLFTALGTIASNPAILQNKGTRTMLFKLLGQFGLSPIDLNLIESLMDEAPPVINPLPAGPSMAAPTPGQPVQGGNRTY